MLWIHNNRILRANSNTYKQMNETVTRRDASAPKHESLIGIHENLDALDEQYSSDRLHTTKLRSAFLVKLQHCIADNFESIPKSKLLGTRFNKASGHVSQLCSARICSKPILLPCGELEPDRTDHVPAQQCAAPGLRLGTGGARSVKLHAAQPRTVSARASRTATAAFGLQRWRRTF